MFPKLSRARKPGKKAGQEPGMTCEWEVATAGWNLGVRAGRMESLYQDSDLGAIK